MYPRLGLDRRDRTRTRRADQPVQRPHPAREYSIASPQDRSSVLRVLSWLVRTPSAHPTMISRPPIRPKVRHVRHLVDRVDEPREQAAPRMSRGSSHLTSTGSPETIFLRLSSLMDLMHDCSLPTLTSSPTSGTPRLRLTEVVDRDVAHRAPHRAWPPARSSASTCRCQTDPDEDRLLVAHVLDESPPEELLYQVRAFLGHRRTAEIIDRRADSPPSGYSWRGPGTGARVQAPGARGQRLRVQRPSLRVHTVMRALGRPKRR